MDVHNVSFEGPMGSLSHLQMPEFNLSDVTDVSCSTSKESSMNSVRGTMPNGCLLLEKAKLVDANQNAEISLVRSTPDLPDLGLGVQSLRHKVDELKLSSIQPTEEFAQLNRNLSEAEENARKLIANLQLNSGPTPTPIELESYSSSVSLQLLEEKKRREHCEAVIATLQKELLKAQEEASVAQASSGYKSTLLQKAHEACNLLLKEAESRRLAWEKQLENLRDAETSQANRIQEYETGLSQILDLADQWKMRLAQTEEERNRLKKECRRLSSEFEVMCQEKSRLDSMLLQAKSECEKERVKATSLQQELEVARAHQQRCMEQLKTVQQEQESLKQAFNQAKISFKEKQEHMEQKFSLELANTKRQADLEALERQKTWQREAETKLNKLVTSCEDHVLHIRAKCAEEIQTMKKRYEDSVRDMQLTITELQRNCVQQTADKERLAKQLQKLLEAQWQQVSTMISSQTTIPTPATAGLEEGTGGRNHQQILRAAHYLHTESITQVSTTECSEIESSAWEEDAVSVQAKKVDLLRYLEELKKRKEISSLPEQPFKGKAK